MKKNYKFDPNEHESTLDALIDFTEDFAKMVSSKRWKCKDQLKKYESLKQCFKQFQVFEQAYINWWNTSEYPFEFWESWCDAKGIYEEVLEDGVLSLNEALESLSYHLNWYNDRMNQNRMLVLHLLWILVLELANDFSKENDN